jgi:Fe-S oxidoreductase/nitrate reductase gamma subunit
VTDPAVPTREVFGNVAPWMQAVFYGVTLLSLAISGWLVARRARLWAQGCEGEWERDPRVWLRRLLEHGLAQRRVRRRRVGGPMHVLLFSGFLVLLIGTTLLFIADRGPVQFHQGAYYLVYELVMDLFGVALILGCVLALHRRLAARPASLGHRRSDYYLLSLLLLVGITGFLVEGLRLRWDGTAPVVARWSPIGAAVAAGSQSLLSTAGARSAHLALWWVHTVLIAVFFSTFALTRFLHVVTGTLNLMLRPSRPAGALPTTSLEAVERTGRMGTSEISHLARQQLLSLDACMECGRCEEACPAFASGKPLSPKQVVIDLRGAMERNGEAPQEGGASDLPIAAETLWACTMCQACVFECPVLIGHVDLIADMRRYRVGEGQLAGPPGQALRRLGSQGNPFGQPPGERAAWAEGLAVPTVEENPDFDILLWVGCAASYDPRARKVARATAMLLQRAGVSFAVLGKAERCTGDPARRLGEEFLFQQLAGENAGRLAALEGRRIVTPCPHCLNTLRNEYGEFGAVVDVLHHSQLLATLVREGRLRPEGKGDVRQVTLHDPCYLARVNGETAAPRELIATSGAELREMPRRGDRTFCCGAGGGRMWFEEPPAQRVNRLRAEEAAATGAGALITGCPFCVNMMTDGVAGIGADERLRVLDVAELLLEACDE